MTGVVAVVDDEDCWLAAADAALVSVLLAESAVFLDGDSVLILEERSSIRGVTSLGILGVPSLLVGAIAIVISLRPSSHTGALTLGELGIVFLEPLTVAALTTTSTPVLPIWMTTGGLTDAWSSDLLFRHEHNDTICAMASDEWYVCVWATSALAMKPKNVSSTRTSSRIFTA